jgi:hypothetical protein
VIEEFILRLTPSSSCIWDTLTKSSEIADTQYIVTTAVNPVTISPVFTRSVVNCLLVQKLYFFNDATNDWSDFGSNAASYPFATFADGLNAANVDIGKLVISATRSAAPAVWKPFKSYRVKITLEDQNGNGHQLISYEFDLELRDVCADNTLTKNSELA